MESGEKGRVVDQQRLGQLTAALEPDLLTGVGSLRLGDFSVGPDKRAVIVEKDA